MKTREEALEAIAKICGAVDVEVETLFLRDIAALIAMHALINNPNVTAHMEKIVETAYDAGLAFEDRKQVIDCQMAMK